MLKERERSEELVKLEQKISRREKYVIAAMVVLAVTWVVGWIYYFVAFEHRGGWLLFVVGLIFGSSLIVCLVGIVGFIFNHQLYEKWEELGGEEDSSCSLPDSGLF